MTVLGLFFLILPIVLPLASGNNSTPSACLNGDDNCNKYTKHKTMKQGKVYCCPPKPGQDLTYEPGNCKCLAGTITSTGIRLQTPLWAILSLWIVWTFCP